MKKFEPTLAYKKYALVLLTSIMVFNYVDRLAIGLLIQDIKLDLQISDTQLGFLTGIAFAVFYAGMGIPIARWADVGNRISIISLTTGLWSVAVCLCASAASFVQLLLIRMGVAVGEAGCHPPAFSLIADYYSRHERPRAIARYMLGWPLALLIGNFAGGWLNQLFGWRLTLVMIAIPGVVLALLARFTLVEPRKYAVQPLSEKRASPKRPVGEVLRTLWKNKAFRYLLFCFSLSYFFGNGILQWQPAFFQRSHGMQTGELGTWLAVIYGLGGLFGTWLGGELCARFAANNERLQLVAMALLYTTLVVISGAVYATSNVHVALGMLMFSSIGGAMLSGPIFAATQTIVPADMRAMSIAVVLFFSNLIGLGLGPLTVGAASDLLIPWLGTESLRYALLLLCPGYLLCAWFLMQAGRIVGPYVAEAQLTEDRATALAQHTVPGRT